MKRSGAWFEVGVAIVIIAIGVAITMTDTKKRESVADEIASMPSRERNLAVFDAATTLLKSNYYDSKFFTTPEWQTLEARWHDQAAETEPPRLYANVLEKLADEFPESHVAFVPPERLEKEEPSAKSSQTADQRERLQFNYQLARSGPGFDAPEIRRSSGRLHVIDDVLRGSPAERAGVMPGWILLSDNTDVSAEHALYTAEVLQIDPEMSRATETSGRLQRSGTPTMKLEFALEKLPARVDFETRQLAGGVTYLRFDVFESSELVEKVLEAIDDAGPAGLIIDLRRNPGGRLLHLQRVVGALLGKEATLGTTRTADSSTPMASWRFADHYRGPLVVLIGPSTASAAEITAAAVQDHARGKLVGRTTNGSVVPGQWFELPDGGKMMIPVSDFIRSNGRRIEGAGVEPDVWVLPTLADVRAGRDPALERALLEISGSWISRVGR
jgi:carboxyl-terminal processing protease